MNWWKHFMRQAIACKTFPWCSIHFVLLAVSLMQVSLWHGCQSDTAPMHFWNNLLLEKFESFSDSHDSMHRNITSYWRIAIDTSCIPSLSSCSRLRGYAPVRGVLRNCFSMPVIASWLCGTQPSVSHHLVPRWPPTNIGFTVRDGVHADLDPLQFYALNHQ